MIYPLLYEQFDKFQYFNLFICFFLAGQHLFISRLAGGFSDEVRARIIFYSPDSLTSLLDALAGGHVLLDPFPVSALLPNLQALSVGLPVITLPSDKLGGRFATALYNILDYGMKNQTINKDGSTTGGSGTINSLGRSSSSSSADAKTASYMQGTKAANLDTSGQYLIANSVNEYITTALSICHKPKLREQHAAEIMRRKYRLYSNELLIQAAEDWSQFMNKIVVGKKVTVENSTIATAE